MHRVHILLLWHISKSRVGLIAPQGLLSKSLIALSIDKWICILRNIRFKGTHTIHKARNRGKELFICYCWLTNFLGQSCSIFFGYFFDLICKILQKIALNLLILDIVSLQNSL
jgi:hypothetical protein